MTWWNCKRVVRLLPLQVAGDLEGARGLAVAAHLATCQDCRQRAAGFAESRARLTDACRPPAFNSDFYTEIRSSVLGEIVRQRTASRPPLFQRRWLYATAFAGLLMAFGLLLLQFGAKRRVAPQLVKKTNGAKAPLVPQPEIGPSPQRHASGGSDHKFPRRRIEKTNDAGNAAKGAQREPTPDTEAMAALITGGSGFEAARPAASSVVATALPVAVQPVSRIEIQTANPNIRIIWLAQQVSEPAEQVDHDQDQNENGDRR